MKTTGLKEIRRFSMHRSCYGKMLESGRTRVQVRLTRTLEGARKETGKSFKKAFKIIDENIAAATLKNPKFHRPKPTIVAACILGLSKFHMFRFHYEVKKEHFKCELVSSDTDLLLYEVKHQDIYRKLPENCDLRKRFDFLKYPSNHPLFKENNKLVTLKLKSELGGKVMKDFSGLKPKM